MKVLLVARLSNTVLEFSGARFGRTRERGMERSQLLSKQRSRKRGKLVDWKSVDHLTQSCWR